MGKVNDEATNNNDAAAVAAQYTRDAVFVTTEGPIIGRQAIQKWFSEIYKWWHPKIGSKCRSPAKSRATRSSSCITSSRPQPALA
jgi:ketosteroid isomerase-like protein